MAVIRIEYEVDKSQVDAADDSLKELDTTTDEATESTEEFNEATGSLGDQLQNVANKFTIAGKGAGDLGAGLGKTAKGAASATKASNILSLAMKAIPIIALIAGFVALIAFFTKTERGAQKLRVIMAVLGAAFSAVTDVVILFGEKLFNAINDPQQALDDLKDKFVLYFTEFIPNAIDKVLAGLGLLGEAIVLLFEGDFTGALASAKEGVIELADGITDLNPGTAIIKSLVKEVIILGEEVVRDAEAAALLENRLNKVLVAERKLSVARAQANAQIEQEKLLAEDVTKSFEEREAAAVRAFELETKLLNQEIALQKERVAIIQQQNALSESTEEDLQNEADALIRLAEIEQASGTKQIELNNKINQIRAERLRLIEAEEKAIEDLAETEKEAREELFLQIAAEQAAMKALQLKNDEEIRESRQETFDQNVELARSFNDVLNQFGANRISRLQQEKQKELAVEGRTAEEKEKIEEEFNALILEEQRKTAQRNKALSLFDIGINTAVAITKALPNIPLSIIVGALGAAQAIAVAATPLPFKEGVINLQGGVRGKDSIPSLLTPGESVMTARETSDFLPTLNAIRKGQVDADVLNALAGGQIVDNTKVIKVPGTEFHLDSKGFAAHIRTTNGRVIKKQNKYSSKLFS